MSKNKDKKDKKDNYNFDVFKNYKCDGQYKMMFNDNKVDIVEEQDDNKSLTNQWL